MRNAITLITLAGLTSVAGAQSGTLSIVPSASTVDNTGAAATLTLAVYGDADFGTAISGGGFGIAAVGNTELISEMSVSVASWGQLGFMDLGYGGDGNYNGVTFGQFIFPPALPPAAGSMLGNGPVYIGSFTVIIPENVFGRVDLTTVGGVGDFTLEVFDGATGSFTQLDAAVNHASTSIIIFPAPSGLALLGLGGLVAGRRRR